MPALFVCVVVFAVFVSFGAFSQQSLREFESTSEFEKALAAVDAIKHRKKMQCVLAIPNWALCECLAQRLPVDIYLRSYASITEQEKGLEYRELSVPEKKIVDHCVSNSR
jgi:hypothetical protein